MSATQGRVGELPATDGSIQPLRLGKYGDVVTQDGHGRYTEGSYRGRRYVVSTQAAVALSLTGTTTYTGLLLNNPLNSGVIASIEDSEFGVSSTITASGAIALGYNTANPSALGTVLASQPTKLSSSGVSGARCVAYSGGTTTLAANPTVVRILATSQFGTSVGVEIAPCRDEIGGQLELMPGTCIFYVALTTAVTGWWALQWEELPTSVWT